MDSRAVVDTAIDPDGRSGELTAGRWRHILDGHPELALHQHQILAAIRTPGQRRAGRWPGEEWFYLRTARPSRWLKVVVVYEGGRGRIVTAFPRRSVP